MAIMKELINHLLQPCANNDAYNSTVLKLAALACIALVSAFAICITK